MSIEGPSDTDSLGIYIREILAPTLESAQIVLMDNLSVHTSGWVREIVQQRGAASCGFCRPTLRTIEPHRRRGLLEQVKALLRRAKARVLEALFEATEAALLAVSSEDARGYFGHCGYTTPQAHSI